MEGVYGATNLVYESEGHAQCIRYRCCPFCTSRIWTHYHRLLVIWDLILDVAAQEVATVQVVHWNIEETLVLRIVKVHCDDMVGSGAGEEVCD
jgi:hypothetical protein